MPVESLRSNRGVASHKRKRRTHRRRTLRMEGLEARQLLAAGLGTNALPTVDPNIFAPEAPRNIGTVVAFQINEAETASEFGLNDSLVNAQLVPLGTGPGDEDTIDVNGSMRIRFGSQGSIGTDIDTYAFDLEAGDILDLAIQGAGSNLTVFDSDGQIWFGTDVNTALGTYPDGSPLMNVGNAVGAQVVSESGRYYVTVAPTVTSVNYTLGMRAYRPVLEQAPIGAQQIVYLDFDGGIYPTSDFPSAGLPLGIVRIAGLQDSLALLGFTNPIIPQDVNAIIDATVNEAIEQMATLAQDGSLGSGTNGDFASTGIAGEYGITILNSRDHADPGNSNPLVTRVIIGSEATTGFPPGSLFGIAQSIDVGNFRPQEKVLAGLEPHAAAVAAYPISPTSNFAEAISQQLAATITHELGHSFGIFHTDGDNFTDNLMDEGSQSLIDFSQGVGNDGIFGTNDDITPYFNNDRFSTSFIGNPGEDLFFGTERVPASLSHALSSGTVGSTLTGRAFVDANRNGNGSGDAGLSGVTVFADINLNGTMDSSEPSAVTDTSGNYAFVVAPGTFSIVAITPAQFVATTLTNRPGSGGQSGIDFGFYQVISDVTGTKFADTNGNGIFDPTESGVEGVYIYLDLDGDDRPDIGEPSARTDSSGQYSINFPGAGTYTIREVVEPGFIQTFPASGEHIVVYNGIALPDNYNFGNLPSRDYGDAPDTYQTTVATDGPSHGISTGLGLGAEVDRETNGIPTADALGDDKDNINDEDGVALLSPLGPDGEATLAITTRNTSSSPAFLQGWIDFNANGVFDASEQVFTDVSLGAGTTSLTVNVPADAVVGSTFARFRYSPTAGLGVGGAADVGEVEDYQVDILEAAQIANDDEFTVSRNSLSNQLDVLANDFDNSTTRLTVIQLNTAGTSGVTTIAQDGRSVFYTPPNGFTGRDVFEYVVTDQLGNRYSASVVVNVNFQSNVPIAVDDTFDIPQGSSNRALNVLDNDVPSIFGGISITSVSAGDQGGQVSLEGGGQTIRYTPQPGFAGTEQFIYSIEDANGTVSTAQVTVNSQPGAMNDDLIDFTIGIFDVVNNQPISNVQVGQPFFVRVFVQELNNQPFSPEGVASAFLDLLYTDELVSTNDTDSSDNFGFDITFGENFQGSGFKLGDATTPGLIDDVGAVQPIPGDGNLIQHSDPAELFTITMTAVSPGVALFASDPADAPVAESILVGEDFALTPAQQRLGRTELTIFPASDDFSSAIDDAFVVGTDSNGVVISDGNAPNSLDVLANDIFGPTGVIQEFGIATAPSLGTAIINDNGTPNNLNDDSIDYFANVNASGFDSFTYLIVSADGVRSVAEVTMAIGNAAADDIVEISFGLVDQFDNPITSVASGQTFGIQVIVEDLRTAFEGNTFVFAGYLDMLYDSGVIAAAAPAPGSRYDFDVEFDADFDEAAGVGTAVRKGIIDEFGSLLKQTVAGGGSVLEPNLMATVYFTASTVSSTTSTQVIGSPADASPFQDTLLFDRDEPVEVSQIRYNVLEFTVTPGNALQNSALPEDVNVDGIVTPLDALSVINTLAREGEGEGEANASGLFTDVNGDSRTSAIDALRVINYLAAAAAANLGEGESVVANLPVDPNAVSDDGVRAEAFADLDQQSKLAGGESAGGQVAISAVAISLSDADDDDDDILSLLADDQSGLA